MSRLWIEQDVNVWERPGDTPVHQLIWSLLDDEADRLIRTGNVEGDADAMASWYATLVAMQRGLRKVMLRPDALRRYLEPPAVLSDSQAVHAGIASRLADGASVWDRLARYLASLVEASGSINPDDVTNTRRRSL